MDRRRFLLTSLAGVLPVPLTAGAQQAEKGYRIGLLATRPSPLLLDPFVTEMHRYGWTQGSNYALLARFTDGEQQRAAVLATELANLRVDVLLTIKRLAHHARQDRVGANAMAEGLL